MEIIMMVRGVMERGYDIVYYVEGCLFVFYIYYLVLLLVWLVMKEEKKIVGYGLLE